jgi:hypothetical protein
MHPNKQLTPSRSTTKLPKKNQTVAQKKHSKKQGKKQTYESSTLEVTRVDDYAQHLKNTPSSLPNSVRYLVVMAIITVLNSGRLYGSQT